MHPAQSIEVIDEGEFVRPTDEIDQAMLKAVMKKAALEGAAAVQQAAARREIIKCSGSFATAATNDHNVSVWNMDTAAKDEEAGVATDVANAATLSLSHVLDHQHAARPAQRRVEVELEVVLDVRAACSR